MNHTLHFSLFNWILDKEFTIRIIHATNPQLDVVQVYYQDKMAAVAHTIGKEQLPSEELVRVVLVAWGTFYEYRLTLTHPLTPAWISNHMPSKVWMKLFMDSISKFQWCNQ